MPSPQPAAVSRKALFSAFGAFLFWGILPLYWKALSSVDAVETLCHRMLWSFVTLLPVMLFLGALGPVITLLKKPKTALLLACSGFILGGNWLLYIWAVNNNRVLDAGLGYYINPLLNVLFGVAFFREKISALAWTAIGLAALGVANEIFVMGRLPLVSLGLGGSFAVYALLRKISPVESLPGLFVETSVMLPFAAAWLLHLASQGHNVFQQADPSVVALLISSGLVTTTPLVWFARSARQIPLSLLGLLQYITPTMAFLIGAFVFHEPLTTHHMVTFALIWAGLALYSFDSLRQRGKQKNSPRPEE